MNHRDARLTNSPLPTRPWIQVGTWVDDWTGLMPLLSGFQYTCNPKAGPNGAEWMPTLGKIWEDFRNREMIQELNVWILSLGLNTDLATCCKNRSWNAGVDELEDAGLATCLKRGDIHQVLHSSHAKTVELKLLGAIFMCVWNPLFHMFFFTIVQLEHGDQASSDWPDPTKLGHWKGSGLRTLSHVPASFWIAVFGTVARAVKYRLVRYSGSIYVMFDHDWHTLTW